MSIIVFKNSISFIGSQQLDDVCSSVLLRYLGMGQLGAHGAELSGGLQVTPDGSLLH